MHVLDGAVEAFDRPLVRFRIEPTSTHGFRTSQRYPKIGTPASDLIATNPARWSDGAAARQIMCSVGTRPTCGSSKTIHGVFATSCTASSSADLPTPDAPFTTTTSPDVGSKGASPDSEYPAGRSQALGVNGSGGSRASDIALLI